MRATGFVIDGASIARQRGSVAACPDVRAQGVALEMAMRSDTGRRREHNEDAVFADAGLGLALVADGLGGHNAGEVASAMAVACLSAGLLDDLARLRLRHRDSDRAGRYLHGCLAQHIREANEAILAAARTVPEYAGMGTTLVAAVFHGGRVVVAHLGDSRLYRLRAGAFSLLTCDHSLLQEEVNQGLLTPQAARSAPHRNVITRALGVDVGVQPEIAAYDVAPGDVYLLCSDGLSDMLDDAAIAATLMRCADDVDMAADELVRLANACGGHDNVSVALVRLVEEGAVVRRGLDGLLGRLGWSIRK